MAERLTARAAAGAILARARAGRATVLVDGRSGSGKTTFATALATAAGARVLRLDDLYPGWDGLEATAAALSARILGPRRGGAVPTPIGWDWSEDRPGPLVPVRPGGLLVVEGCGALSRASARLAEVRVWIELAEPARRDRALARDGAAYAPHWERWARQERRLLGREDPVRLADLVVDGRTIDPCGPIGAMDPLGPRPGVAQ